MDARHLLAEATQIMGFGPQDWGDQERRLRILTRDVPSSTIREAIRIVEPYSLERETTVYGVGHPNIPLPSMRQQAAEALARLGY